MLRRSLAGLAPLILLSGVLPSVRQAPAGVFTAAPAVSPIPMPTATRAVPSGGPIRAGLPHALPGDGGLCGRELAWATAYAARNYAGYADKVTSATRFAYNALLDSLGIAAEGAPNDAACDAVLVRWIAFFRDRHLSTARHADATAMAAGTSDVAAAGADMPSADAVRARFAAWPRVALDEATARARLAALGPDRAPVEGIWESPPYVVAVVRDALLAPAGPDAPRRVQRGRSRTIPSSFTMVVLRADSIWWIPGQVKAHLTTGLTAVIPTTTAAIPSTSGVAISAGIAGVTRGAYRAEFYVRNHTAEKDTVRVEGDALLLATPRRGRSLWVRRWPTRPGRDGEEDRAAVAAETLSTFAVRELAPGTMLVRVPTFGDTRAMDSLVAAEGDRIRGADRLIIDVRGNGGGSDYNYRAFRPLLYTQPVREVNASVLATDDNLRAWRALLGDPGLSDAQRTEVRAFLDTLQQDRTRARAAGRGDWVDQPDETRTETAALLRPQRIAVLIDRRCASSCEQFLLEARQSRKTVLYGETSAGVLDYANVRQAAAADTSAAARSVPGSTLVLQYPTTRSKRLPADPVDNVGIAPAVSVPPDVVLRIAWVRRQLEVPRHAPTAAPRPDHPVPVRPRDAGGEHGTRHAGRARL
jgi:Peptidase family S41